MRAASTSKRLTIAIISFLVVAFVYGSYIRSDVSAAVSRGPITCTSSGWSPSGPQSILGVPGRTCCQTETDDEGIEIKWCTDCATSRPTGSQCGNRYQALDSSTSPTPPPPGPKVPLENVLPGGEVFQELTTPSSPPQLGETSPGIAPPTAPEADEEETQPRIIGESPSPTGYCAPIRTPTCIPCDPGLPGSTCVPESDWPPASTTGEETPEAEPTIPPTTGPLGETAPQIAPPLSDEAAQLPTLEEEAPARTCPEGQVLDEETGLCVLEEPEADVQESEDQSSDREAQDTDSQEQAEPQDQSSGQEEQLPTEEDGDNN